MLFSRAQYGPVLILPLLVTIQIVGHFQSFVFLVLNPLVIMMVVSCCSYYYERHYPLLVGLLSLILLAHEVVARKFLAGTHDQVGRSLCNISFLASLFFFVATLLFCLLENSRKWKKSKKIVNVLVLASSAIAMSLVFYFFLQDV